MLISVWGAQNVGKTTTALSLVKALLQQEKSVLFISTKPYSELSILLDINIPQEKSLPTAIRTGNLKKSIYQKEDLFYVLAMPTKHDAFDDSFNPQEVKAMLDLSVSTFDVVIVDLTSDMSNLISAWSLSLSDKVLFCIDGELGGVLWLQSIKRALDSVRSKCVFVGIEKTKNIDYTALYELLGEDVKIKIPNLKAKNYNNDMKKLWEVIEK